MALCHNKNAHFPYTIYNVINYIVIDFCSSVIIEDANSTWYRIRSSRVWQAKHWQVQSVKVSGYTANTYRGSPDHVNSPAINSRGPCCVSRHLSTLNMLQRSDTPQDHIKSETSHTRISILRGKNRVIYQSQCLTKTPLIACFVWVLIHCKPYSHSVQLDTIISSAK